MKIRNKFLDFPLIQGGMGVGVSLGRLAGSVMNEGCMGVISCAHPGYYKDDFRKNSLKSNVEGIFEQVKIARDLSKGKGLLGVNIMVASKDYPSYVKASMDSKVDAIISGAGLPLDLPSYKQEGSDILLAPIVSSAKAAELICKVWDKRYNYIPDFIVIESSEAGGHLGFKLNDLVNKTCESLQTIIKGVREIIKPFESKYNYRIPLFGAGGVYDGKDMADVISYGCDGVQIGTRFIATNECDASDVFKQMIVDCKKEDIGLVKSPSGFPGRGIRNSFVKNTEAIGNIWVKTCIGCIKPCNPKDTPYCITDALINSVKGDKENGLFFAGSNAYRIDKIISVKELIDEIKNGYKEAIL